ncbi:hypothetical protein C7212DRAFT_188369 [Tuber magnatum]|uniref:Reverse transcriptase Ty1/copia-type domain-containing protein n=1 Tax=Tuber magnatum TaxID=42249 RepID=A0A317SRV8_9PEZI|nr:hypothetical protein C7212DRAFT_188369 [Tuber magnatum]
MIDSLLLSLGFQKSFSELNIYLKSDFYLVLHIDIMLMIYLDFRLTSSFKAYLNKAYRKTNLKLIVSFLGLEIERYYDKLYAVLHTRYIYLILC